MLNVFELNRIRDEKIIRKTETYRKVLEKIHVRIKENAKEGITFCFYTIPNIVLGLPMFDMEKCAEYVVDRLKKNGLVIIYTYPNLIYVSWEHIPSVIKNPQVRVVEEKMERDPYQDYSRVVHQLAGTTTAALPALMPPRAPTPSLPYYQPSAALMPHSFSSYPSSSVASSSALVYKPYI